MTHTHSNHSKKKWYSERICLFHYTAITTSKHCCSSQSLLFSYSYKLTQTYKLMKSETDKFSPPVQAKADFHIWNFWYVNAFECISWLYLEWKLNWKKVFPVSFTSSEYLSFESQQNVGLLRHTCQLMSIFYSNIGLF